MTPSRHTNHRWRPGWNIALVAALVVAGSCATIEPRGITPPSRESSAKIRHADLEAVQTNFVDATGRVDFAGLKRSSGHLDRYYLWLSEESPLLAPRRFPTTEHEVAYWINAYNASVLVTVLQYYPIASVTEVGSYLPTSLFDKGFGFFVLQRVIIGGTSIDLKDLKAKALQARPEDPRIHFALSSASLGSPGLAPQAFQAEKLDRQLDGATRRFFANPRHLSFNHSEETVLLSPVVLSLEPVLRRQSPGNDSKRENPLLTYISQYAPPTHEAALLRAIEEHYTIEFVDFDWRLNDQSSAAQKG